MFHELDNHQFQAVMPLFDEYFPDPMLYAVLEGRRNGRVFADNASRPTHAFVWTDSESAYLALGQAVAGDEDDTEFLAAFRRLLLEEIIPQARDMGLHFLSLFSFPDAYPHKLEQLLAEQLPLRTPLNTFTFDEATFRQRFSAPVSLPEGFTLKRIDHEVLEQPSCEDLAEEIAFHWGSLDAFSDEGVGYCVVRDGYVVSWCYVEALGHSAQSMAVWTKPDHRGENLGTAVGCAVIHDCLGQGYAPFWICDDGNQPSRRLAERLGFQYKGDIFLVDIPFDPYDFYRSLAIHFFFPQGMHRQAAEAYDRAFSVHDGVAEDYVNAAVGWVEAGDAERALDRIQEAIQHGWTDTAALEEMPAFEPLREMARWPHLSTGPSSLQTSMGEPR
jgi:RimJ/RimL family protein N-acetyltransferase